MKRGTRPVTQAAGAWTVRPPKTNLSRLGLGLCAAFCFASCSPLFLRSATTARDACSTAYYAPVADAAFSAGFASGAVQSEAGTPRTILIVSAVAMGASALYGVHRVSECHGYRRALREPR